MRTEGLTSLPAQLSNLRYLHIQEERTTDKAGPCRVILQSRLPLKRRRLSPKGARTRQRQKHPSPAGRNKSVTSLWGLEWQNLLQGVVHRYAVNRYNGRFPQIPSRAIMVTLLSIYRVERLANSRAVYNVESELDQARTGAEVEKWRF